MKTYQHRDIEYVEPVNLDILHNTLSNLETTHQATVKATSELKTAIANLDLNEAEDGFRNQLLMDIENTIDNNSRHGNLAGAYDDITKIQGDIAGNPALISKLKAQQNYKQFVAEIDARQDLPEHYKEYYKRINPYKEGIYDEQGNWIQGTKWEPTKKAALNISKDKILDTALKYITPNKGSYSVTTYMDENGNLTKQYTPGAKLVRYNTETTQYEEVTEKEIKEALKSAIRMNPQFMDSLKQDYDIAVDDFEDGREAFFNVNNGTGKPISFEQFVDNVFAGNIKAKAYRYTETKNDYNDKLYKDLQSMGLSGQTVSTAYGNAYTKPGETTRFKDVSTIVSMNNVKKGNDDIKQLFRNENIEGLTDEFISSIDLSNPEAFNQAIAALDITPENKETLTTIYNVQRSQYAEDIHNDRKYRELYGDTKMYAGKSTISSITSGKFPVEEEMTRFEKRYKNQWDRLNNIYFPKGTQAIQISTPNKNTYDEFVRLVKEAGLEDYFVLGNRNNKFTITLDRSNNSKLPELADLYNKAREVGRKGKHWKHFWDEYGSQAGLGETIWQVSEKGGYTNMLDMGDQFFNNPYYSNIANANKFAGTRFGEAVAGVPIVSEILYMIDNGLVPDVGNMLSPITQFVSRMDSYADEFGQGQNRTITNVSFNSATPEGIIADTRIINKDYEDNTELTELTKIRNEANEASFIEVQTAGLRNVKVQMLDKDGILTPVVDSKEIADLEKQLLNAKATDANSLCTVELDWGTGRYFRKLKFTGEDNKPVVITVDDDHNNYLYDLNKDPRLNSLKKFYQSQVTGQDIRLGPSHLTDLYVSPDGNGNFTIFSEDAPNNPWFTFNPKDDGKIFNLVTNLPTYTNNIETAILSNNQELLNENIINYCKTYVDLLAPTDDEKIRESRMKDALECVIEYYGLQTE